MSHVDDGTPPSDPIDLTRPVIDAEPITGQQRAIPAPDAAGNGSTTEKPKWGQSRSEWRRAEKARRYAARNSVRFPIFTRSILLWLLIFALTGVAFGASGAFWWANFNSQVSELRNDTQDFESRSSDAQSQIEDQRKQALDDIN